MTAAAQPLYKAVCYRCKFEGGASATTCPKCSFPVILEAENTPPGGARLDDILRSGNERPRLPGVATPRSLATPARPLDEPPRAPDRAIPLPPPAPRSRRWQQIKVALVCSAAVVVGVLAGVIHQGL